MQIMKKLSICCVGLALLVGCSSTTKDVRSGRAWEGARPADYKATADEVLREVEKFLSERDYQIRYEDGKTLVKAYKSGDDPLEQNIEVHVRIDARPEQGITRVTAISGRSIGVEWQGRRVHDRLQTRLREVFGGR